MTFFYRYAPQSANDVQEKSAPLPEDMRADIEEFTSSIDFSLVQTSVTCVAMTSVEQLM